jgi:YidC/Oxa1 family membrane protein insertase
VSILNPLFEAVAWVMMGIHSVLSKPFGASSGVTWALTIIILVVLMRLVMVPLFIKQRNSMWKMQSHMPQLQEIRKKYKNDKTRLNEETMKFYKENGINPLGGCLPLVAQLPVFWALFNVLKALAQWQPPAKGQVAKQPAYGMKISFVESAHEAKIFGISLYDQFLHPVLGETTTSRLLIVVFVLVSAVTTFLTMRQSQRRGMMNQTAPDPDQPGAAAAQAMSKNMMYIAPFFALTGLYWQFGLVLYWVTTNVWTLGQQHFLFRKLPIVGSTTVGASAVGAASGSAGTGAKSAVAKTGTAGAAVRTGTKSAPAKAGTAKAGAAKPGAARPVTAKAGTAKAGTAKATATKPAAKADGTASSAAKAKSPAAKVSPAKAAGAKTAAAAKTAATQPADSTLVDTPPTDTPPTDTAPTDTAPVDTAPVDTAPAEAKAAKAKASANGASANGSTNGSSVLRRFGRSKEEPQDDVPVAPQTKVVRQQPSRTTRSKRNTGKR